MDASPQPRMVRLFTALFVLAALATGYVGLSAFGFLVAAACLLLEGVLLWFGRARSIFTGIMMLNLVSGLLMVLVIGLGDGLGRHKLDISGVAMLVNFATGGPLMGLIAPALLAVLLFGTSLRAWFDSHGSRSWRRQPS
jgi:hypothetical protein